MDNDLYVNVKAGVVNTIKSLELDDIDQNVFNQIEGDPKKQATPCVVCTTAKIDGDVEDAKAMTEELLGGDTVSRDWMFPVKVVICGADIPTDHTQEAKYLRWRKQVVDRFNQASQPKLEGFGREVWNTKVIPRAIIDTKWPKFARVVSAMIVQVFVTEPRG